jgi:molybdopterin molybdotransferase
MNIATGAPTPRGTEAVLPVERGRRRGSLVCGEVASGRHIRRTGEDGDLGERLLPAGTLVSAGVLGLAASLGYDKLLVHRRPTVSVLVTGDEVRLRGRPRPGQVRDSIGPMLPELITVAGGRLLAATMQKDSSSVLLHAIACDQADVLVVCGGTSLGPADHVRSVLNQLSAELLVDTVACRPGHPQLLAVLPGGRYVVGLPGNPFAALAAALTLLSPLLGALAGRRVANRVTTKWEGGTTPHPTHTRLVPVRDDDGRAVPVGHDRSGTLLGVALSDALAVLPPRWSGHEVELLRLP